VTYERSGGWSWSRSSFQLQWPSASASFLVWSGRTLRRLQLHQHLRRRSILIRSSTGRVRVIACRTSSPLYRNLHCSPTASQWHPRSPIRSWAALLVAAPHNVPAFSRRLLPPVRPGISADDAAPRAHHARPNVGTGNVVGPTIGAQHRLMVEVPSTTPQATACRWRAYLPRAAQYCGPGRGKKTGGCQAHRRASPRSKPRPDGLLWATARVCAKGALGSICSKCPSLCAPVYWTFVGHQTKSSK
jgi:hypothetical protein